MIIRDIDILEIQEVKISDSLGWNVDKSNASDWYALPKDYVDKSQEFRDAPVEFSLPEEDSNRSLIKIEDLMYSNFFVHGKSLI